MSSQRELLKQAMEVIAPSNGDMIIDIALESAFNPVALLHASTTG